LRDDVELAVDAETVDLRAARVGARVDGDAAAGLGDGAGVEAHLGARADDLEHGGLQGEGEAKARRDEERARRHGRASLGKVAANFKLAWTPSRVE